LPGPNSKTLANALALKHISHVALSILVQSGAVVEMQLALIISETNHLINNVAHVVFDNDSTHTERRHIHLRTPHMVSVAFAS